MTRPDTRVRADDPSIRALAQLLSGFVLAIGLAVFLSGCVDASGTSSVSRDRSRADLESLARAGNPAAQIALGDATCCEGRGRSYAEATKWYCEAATLGHADAHFRLGQVYSGQAGRTLLGSSRQLRLTPTRRDLGLAFFYYSQAARLGRSDGAAKASALRLNAEERLAANGYMAEPTAAPCHYNTVFQL